MNIAINWENGQKEIKMSQDNLIRFICSDCKKTNYWSHKNRKKVERKLEFKKFCKWCRKHTMHKEGKKK